MKNLASWRADNILHSFQVYFLHLKDSSSIYNTSVSLLPLLAILFILLFVAFRLIRWAIHLKKTLQEDSILLELTPPAFMQKTAYTTQQLFSVIHNLGDRRTFWDRLFGKKIVFSFEIASTLNQGIRYLIRTTPDEVNNVKRSLISYLPQVSVKIANEYLPPQTKVLKSYFSKVVEFKLKKHFAYPLQKQEILKEHDPVAYITGMMTKLSPGELISFQIVLSPIQTGKTDNIQRKILNNEDILSFLNGIELPVPIQFISSLLMLVVKMITALMGFIAWGITDLVNSGRTTPTYQTQIQRPRPVRILSTFEQETIKSVQEKIDQPLFETSIRLLVLVKDKHEQKERIKGFISSLAVFSVPKYQSLKLKFNFLPLLIDRIRLFAFRKRLLSILFNNSSSLLSVSEVSDLFHFPSRVTQTENIVKIHSKQLPAPLSLKKSDTNFDVIIGVNQYGGELSPIGVTLEQRQKHMYVIGKTGMGKTEMLKNMILQDMINGKGLAVLDPHGDLIQDLLRIIPKNRKEDVVYLDPSDREWPIGLNLLSPGIKFINKEDEHDWITSSVLVVFKKLSDEQYWGPRMEHILRNTTLTALQTPNPTLFTLQRLLTDKKYQKEVATTLKDPVLKQFWQKEFALMGNMQLSAVTAPLTQRLGSFISSKMSRHILLRENSTVSIQQIMDEGKILLINLSKGDLGEDQSFFFGTILTSLIWMAAYQRTKIPESQRKDFFVYIDEFQNFATPQFSEITSEGRKFHVSLIVSHQNIAQIENKDTLKIVAGNAHIIVCLNASPDDEAFILPYMDPEVEKGNIVNLAPFHFFMKVTTDESEDAFSGKTVPLDVESSEKTKDEIIAYTRKHYAIPRVKVEKYLEKLFAVEPKKKSKAKVRKPIIKPKGATKRVTKRGV